MKKQVLLIHGGNVFDKYEEYLLFLKNKEINLEKIIYGDWKKNLQNNLGSDYEVIAPQMPNSQNARYIEWEIWFKKIINLVNDDIILIGHSLGGIFLAKFLSENDFPKKIKATFLVSAPFDDKDIDEKLLDFNLKEGFDKFEEQSKEIFLYHSKDDPVVSFGDLEKYKSKLPKAKAFVFEDRGHFNQRDFPEIVEEINNLE